MLVQEGGEEVWAKDTVERQRGQVAAAVPGTSLGCPLVPDAYQKTLQKYKILCAALYLTWASQYRCLLFPSYVSVSITPGDRHHLAMQLHSLFSAYWV